MALASRAAELHRLHIWTGQRNRPRCTGVCDPCRGRRASKEGMEGSRLSGAMSRSSVAVRVRAQPLLPHSLVLYSGAHPWVSRPCEHPGNTETESWPMRSSVLGEAQTSRADQWQPGVLKAHADTHGRPWVPCPLPRPRRVGCCKASDKGSLRTLGNCVPSVCPGMSRPRRACCRESPRVEGLPESWDQSLSEDDG